MFQFLTSQLKIKIGAHAVGLRLDGSKNGPILRRVVILLNSKCYLAIARTTLKGLELYVTY